MKKIFLLIFMFAAVLTVHAQARYVTESGAGTKSGTSWTNASDDLQAMINGLTSGGEIRVSAGTYYPKHSADGWTTAAPTGVNTNPNDRKNAFVLKPNVKIYGGYPEGSSSNRNWATNVTVLSGDLGVHGDATDNAYHVVISDDDVGTATLDGLTITGGNANAGFFQFADVNGDNINLDSGGGIFINESSPTLNNLIISGNQTEGNGGGILIDYSSPVLTNVLISGNYAGTNGGGMYNSDSSPKLTNVTISGNKADLEAGGVYNNHFSYPVITNTIVWGNDAFVNENVFDSNSAPVYSYSLIEGKNPTGTGNINGIPANDPKFKSPSPVGANNAPTTAGDYSLQKGSSAFNTGDNNAYVTARGISGILTSEKDLAANPRLHSTNIDIGAYANAIFEKITFTWVCENSKEFSIRATTSREFTVEWGDGSTVDTYTGSGTSAISHDYSNPGTYTVTVTAKTIDCKFTYLYIESKNISSLNISDAFSLTQLRCYDNQLTSLDLSNNTALTDLRCYDNQLTGLDISNNTALGYIFCYNNAIPLADLYATSQKSSVESSKRLGPQTLPQQTVALNVAVPVDAVFNGTNTDFVMGKLGGTLIEGIDYTRSGGTFTFLTSGIYTFEITNPAITSSSSYPAKVIATYVVGTGVIPSYNVPFVEDFENTSTIFASFVNGSQTNQWFRGNADAATGYSAYISNDGGISNSFSNRASYVYLFMDVYFTPSDKDYYLNFYWKCQGNSDSYLSVYITGTDILPVAGQPYSGEVLSSYSGKKEWQYSSIVIPASYSGTTKRVVFYWKNSGGVGSSSLPPIAIDDVSINNKLPSSLTISQQTPISYGTTPDPQIVSKTGDGTISYEYKVRDADDNTYSTIVPRNAGNYTVRGIISETTTYGKALSASVNFSISKVTLTVTADNNSKTYGADNPELTVSYSGFVNGDDATKLTTAPTASITATTTSTPGTSYNITVSGGVSSNYTFTYVRGNFTIIKATLTVTAADKSKPQGTDNPVLTFSYSGFVLGETATDLTTQPRVSTTATLSSPGGTYPITVSGGTSSKYQFEYIAGTMTVIPSGNPDLTYLKTGSTAALTPAFSPDNTEYTFTMPDGEKSVTFNADAYGYGTVTYSNGTGEINTPGIHTLTITSTSEDGKATKDYVITVNYFYPTAIIQRYWDDVLVIDLNTANNGGYSFVSYQWTRDGEPIAGETKSFLNLDGKPAGTYNVLITADGNTVQVREGVVITVSRGLRVYPNPISSNATVENQEWKTVKYMQLFDMSGRLVREYPVGGETTSIDLSGLSTGIYLLQTGKQTIKIIKN